MRISEDVLAILDQCATEGPQLTLPGQLDRPDYLAVDKVLKAGGGKWNRSARAHIFDRDAAGVIDDMLITGEIITRQEMGYFPTPPALVDQLIKLADLSPGMAVLEPSAGEGAIAGPVHACRCTVDCFEIDQARAAVIHAAGYANWVGVLDFLTCDPAAVYDRVIMNPPFARQQDIAHVTHALKFLKPRGQLVSVMAAGAAERVNRAASDFRKLVADRGGYLEPLPDDTFKAAGTGVRTLIAVIPAT